jgi:hypothetical protein
VNGDPLGSHAYPAIWSSSTIGKQIAVIETADYAGGLLLRERKVMVTAELSRSLKLAEIIGLPIDALRLDRSLTRIGVAPMRPKNVYA